MTLDEIYMSRALELAYRGRFTTSPNPNVGCVIVKDEQIVGEGFHLRAGEAHAEVHALRMAGEKAKGATAYVTLEPCSHHGKTPPCADALITAGITRVVVAMQDPNPQVAGRGLHKLQQAGIVVEHGLMMGQAESLNKGFLKRMRTGFPYLQLKLGASLDGRTALSSGESKWITSPQARQDVQKLRAQCSAILSSSATVLADDPSLTVRWNELDAETQSIYPQDHLRQPIRIITDSQNRVTPQHQVVQQAGQCWLARTNKNEQLWSDNVEQILLPAHGGGVDLVLLMMQLGKRQINSVWAECGPALAGALLSVGLVDELILYIAPKVLGNNARGLLDIPELKKLSDAPEFTLLDVKQIGPDVRLRLRPV
ncbi:bifunctional diaminohydroxyphosphoribosylaminopyrimidine deaminase/5-amino-6-(5-phosphoribosylamino)uracil reductase RibD [Xenorhabdus szentirmaii]|uniref:Riboflavin biosynthesis protein RibD n=2 Tax=Xenorhabdus szentirmaii TaxID=290112 RepID=W1J1G1_9GAMM|nr:MULTISPECIES: bifunctional diaminohydroxyphosphoribosylaminopyrimidine deaminase/5-amino-6-(5-phosphoribosylamino)uracil reductase RibD [Xenorhabdus]MBD2779536.1 bifunctional diaminohydroxyphosphoribosylaminopyrimidine deaminase/5-amino-6-(5-phosphoribosylamino)uracil reductase RibD [Xenorhabdus sp. 38]MBD2790938.1 bifunctional diaminohydroxyphosphoribosylaminopyrimidine deaminase/5-amino-6-(5-phosphoribosylamino)uracil reductase RibD [Xenorhabdus sp. CUL]MBD2801251.1 bifunctional diaminohydr